MSNMITIIIALVIGGIIACHTICGCCSISKKEGFEGAPLDWSMTSGVPGDNWTQPSISPDQANKNMYGSLKKNVGGPVPPENMFMWKDNLFLPECCLTPQQYSTSTGCACISPDQMKFLSTRGGNNTLP